MHFRGCSNGGGTPVIRFSESESLDTAPKSLHTSEFTGISLVLDYVGGCDDVSVTVELGSLRLLLARRRSTLFKVSFRACIFATFLPDFFVMIIAGQH